MKIKIGDATATGREFFNVVWRGWFYGVMVIFLPFIVVGALVSGFGAGKWQGLLAVLILPLVAALQGVMAGWLVLLGVKTRLMTNSNH